VPYLFPAKINGYYYFDASAGSYTYASYLLVVGIELNRALIGQSARRKPASAERPLSQFVAFNHPVKTLTVYDCVCLPFPSKYRPDASRSQLIQPVCGTTLPTSAPRHY
jgi:hypothetical protein